MEDLNIERVRDMLHARLGDRGIDVDQVYINGVYSLQDPQVIYSQTLVWALFLKFQEGKVPQFKSNHMGIFSEAYTFEEMYRFKALDFDELNSLAIEIGKVFSNEWVIEE